MFSELKKQSNGNLKQKIVLLSSQYSDQEFYIKDLEELIGDDFESFSIIINDFANELNLSIKLIVDPLNKEKFTIIENEDSLYKQSQIESTNALIESEYVPTMAKKQEKIKLFVSYSHKDKEYVEDIINKFESSIYPFEFWKDSEKLISGDNFKGDIRTAIEDYEFGLLMVSENFESDFIIEHELPHFIEIKSSEIKKSRHCIPVCITRKNTIGKLNHIDDSIVFTFDEKGYMETLDKDKFIESLASEIFKAVQKQKNKEIKTITSLQNHTEADEVKKNFINTKAEDDIDVVKEIKEWSYISVESKKEEMKKIEDSLDSLEEKIKNRALMFQNSKKVDPELENLNKEIKDNQELLKELNSEKNISRYFALLGDSGMGKTWSCMKVALELSDEDNELKPIYLDLRHFASSELIEKEFDWKEIIQVVINGSIHSFKKEMSVSTIFDIIQRGKAFVIFDGLDEVTVHLKDDRRANAFIKELKEVVLVNKNNKILFSCRTHYFRNIQEQFSMLCGQDRERIQKKDFMSLELLPFSWEQIEAYCKKKKINFKVFKDIVKSIHNLEEISQRPYSLKLITLQIRKLEELIKQGIEVNSSDIYLNIIEESLNRDSGKHTLSKIHKPLIMRELSAYMWSQGARELEYPDLDEWFSKWMYKHKYISEEYHNVSREKLKADLRGATFMVRPNSNVFRFSHTSLQEFFLAWHLFEAFKNEEYNKFDMKIPSSETIEFFIMLWKNKNKEEYLKYFDNLIHHKSNFAFEIYLIANKLKFDFNYKAQFILEDIYFSNRIIKGNLFKKLDFKNAIFRNVDFSDSELENIDFSGAEFIDCRYMNSTLRNISFENTTLEKCFIKYKKHSGCEFKNIKYIDCDIFD